MPKRLPLEGEPCDAEFAPQLVATLSVQDHSARKERRRSNHGVSVRRWVGTLAWSGAARPGTSTGGLDCEQMADSVTGRMRDTRHTVHTVVPRPRPDW